jgi:hypothetical protein
VLLKPRDSGADGLFRRYRHLRTTNPVESPFAALRLRTASGKRFKRVENGTAVIRKMLLIAEQRFRRLNAPDPMEDIFLGTQYVNGMPVSNQPEVAAA